MLLRLKSLRISSLRKSKQIYSIANPNKQKNVMPQPVSSMATHLAVSLSSLLGIYSFASIAKLAMHDRLTAIAKVPISELLAYLLVFFSVYMAVAIVALTIKNLVLSRLKQVYDLLILGGLLGGSALFTLFYSYQPLVLLICLGTCLALLLLGKRLFKNYSYAGLNFYLANCLGIIIGLAWGAVFLTTMDVSWLTKFLLLCTAPLLLVTIPSDFAQMFELYDIVCKEKWNRPRSPFPRRIYGHQPMVSLHVPTYSEPPDMVIETLNVLSKIDYENYEVLVIDNNTVDPGLWQPVKQHCQKLGKKFRFVHIDNLDGAKGGALNYTLRLTDDKAEIIGVIDADYHADPLFLRALTGHFDDSSVGFVQTPHDYRDWRGNLFQTMCYWEYKIFFHSAMVSLNELGAGITVGTMCLIRKEALLKAGGWSEWCVTEDSELAIRIHDVGYSSVYVDKTYGRGLIPDTFEGYKKQRYRWTAGPVQEFLHHFMHFIGRSGKTSKFTKLQRVYHLNHGFDNILLALNIPLMLLGLGVVTSLIIHHEIVAVPFELWLAATVTFFATPLLTLLMYKATIKPRVVEIIGQLIAARSLSHVIFHAALKTTLTGDAAWNRTSKFKSAESYRSAIVGTKEEITIGVLMAVFVIASYIVFPYTGLSLMLLIGLMYVSLGYFAAPLMAIIGVRSTRKQTSLVSAKAIRAFVIGLLPQKLLPSSQSSMR